jgi:tetratricopeptide (TPR) repeat protein
LVLQDLGDLAGAGAAFERALKIDEASFGPDHPNVATRVNNLGMVLRALGDLAGARAAAERALAIFERALGPDHPKTRTVRGNLDSLGGG